MIHKSFAALTRARHYVYKVYLLEAYQDSRLRYLCRCFFQALRAHQREHGECEYSTATIAAWGVTVGKAMEYMTGYPSTAH